MNAKQTKIQFEPEEPDAFALLEAMVTKTGNVEGFGSLHGVSIRLPTNEFCTVEALAKHSGQSRNKIIVQMIKACVERLNAEMAADELEAVQALRSELFKQFVDGNFPSESGSL